MYQSLIRKTILQTTRYLMQRTGHMVIGMAKNYHVLLKQHNRTSLQHSGWRIQRAGITSWDEDSSGPTGGTETPRRYTIEGRENMLAFTFPFLLVSHHSKTHVARATDREPKKCSQERVVIQRKGRKPQSQPQSHHKNHVELWLL